MRPGLTAAEDVGAAGAGEDGWDAEWMRGQTVFACWCTCCGTDVPPVGGQEKAN